MTAEARPLWTDGSQCHVVQSTCTKSTAAPHSEGGMASTLQDPRASAEPATATRHMLPLRQHTLFLFFSVSTESVPVYVFFPFCCFDVFFPLLCKTCSKPRLKLTLLRDRCGDEVPIIWSTELFMAHNRSNEMGSCRTGIHVIAVSEVITDLALAQAFRLPKHWMEV